MKELRPFFEGSVVQKTVADYYLIDKLEHEEYPHQHLRNVFEEYISDPDLELKLGETRESLYADCERYLKNYIDILRREDLLRLNEVGVEHWYGTHEKPLKLTDSWDFAGACDFYRESPDGDEIYDGKCAKRPGSADVLQLYMYATAHEKYFQRKVRAVHFLYFRNHKVKHTYPFDNDVKGKVIKEMERVSRNISVGNLAAKPSERNCRFCAYRQVCEFSMARQ